MSFECHNPRCRNIIEVQEANPYEKCERCNWYYFCPKPEYASMVFQPTKAKYLQKGMIVFEVGMHSEVKNVGEGTTKKTAGKIYAALEARGATYYFPDDLLAVYDPLGRL